MPHELLTRAHLAHVNTSRTLWSLIAAHLHATHDLQPPQQVVDDLIEACVRHPLVLAAPRDPGQARKTLNWLGDQWRSRGWEVPPEFISDILPPTATDPPDLFYKTYMEHGGQRVGSPGVTLLESGGGITHNTTGLTTWCGAAVLAEWIVNNPAIVAGRRVLELGAGVGFTACVVLTSPSPGHDPPASYTASDCHHHVLDLLYHNISLNLAGSTLKPNKLEEFQRWMSAEIMREEVEAGEVVPWRPPPGGLTPRPSTSQVSPTASNVDAPYATVDECGVAEVGVLQVDWRRPPPNLHPVDVVIAADVVYAHHLIPPLVALIKSILDGSIWREKNATPKVNKKKQGQDQTVMKKGNTAFVDEKESIVLQNTTDGLKGIKNAHKENSVKKLENSQWQKEVDKGDSFEHIADVTKENIAGKKESGELQVKDGKELATEECRKGKKEREAFIACTRRSQETLVVFLEEVKRQGLAWSLVYQATLDTTTALFVYNEAYHPVKIYRITLSE